MKCSCECHTNKQVKHMAACCCRHQYKYDCPERGCTRFIRCGDSPHYLPQLVCELQKGHYGDHSNLGEYRWED